MCTPTLAAGVITAVSAAYGAYATSQISAPKAPPKQPNLQPQKAPLPPGIKGQNFDPHRLAALMALTQGGTQAPGSLFGGNTLGG